MIDHIEILRKHNAWRRGKDESLQMIDPKTLGKSIDLTIAEVERLRAALGAAMTTLEQISTTPRNKGARRSAYATSMFLRTQMEQAK